MHRWRGALQEQRGSSLTLLIVVLPLLLGVLGFVVDAGMYGLSLVRLSSAADSAALAAASAVDFDHYDQTGEVRLDQVRATSKARTYAVANYHDEAVAINVSFLGTRRVRVDLSTMYRTFFLKIFDVNAVPIKAESDAQVGGSAGGDEP